MSLSTDNPRIVSIFSVTNSTLCENSAVTRSRLLPSRPVVLISAPKPTRPPLAHPLAQGCSGDRNQTFGTSSANLRGQVHIACLDELKEKATNFAPVLLGPS
ncbi:Initiation-specific alpha-1,6-mannosyltransferase [Fusarium oxysporum f. sp. albedinis]|nr:Initiation-specific alpha-1,6-mannosyltransferase [Fusarium oxysporum f. sp. albedinis]